MPRNAPARTRTFGGKRYSFYVAATTKTIAERDKNEMVASGYNVRITKYGNVYPVYIRKK